MFHVTSPEEAGISSRHVHTFIDALERRQIHMHSVLLARGSSLFAEYYWAPFHRDFPHRMYSETKSYVSVAIGLLLEDGALSLDDRIADHFPEKHADSLPPALSAQTVRETLTMTTVGGYRNWFTAGDPDRTHLYFDREAALHPAGTVWDYDSAGSQVLCALVEKLAKKSLFDFLYERILQKLGTFQNATILKTPNGDTWGDSALVCTPRDMLSFGRFLLNYGTVKGERLMSEAYLREATSRLVDNSAHAHGGVLSHGYGYQFWRVERDGFGLIGMGNQLTLCLPREDLIFVCTADTQGSATAREYIITQFLDRIASNVEDAPLAENKEALTALTEAASRLALFAVKGAADAPYRERVNGVRYACRENSMGMKEFTLRFDGNKGGTLLYENANGKMELPFLINQNLFGKFPELGYSDGVGGVRTTNGFRYDDAVSAAWLDNSRFRIFVQIIDRYFGNTTLTFSFKDDVAVLSATKAAEDFLWNYEGEAVAYAEG